MARTAVRATISIPWKNVPLVTHYIPPMVYKSLNGLAPNYLSSKFFQRSDVITSYNLRDSDNKLAIPLPRTNHYKNSFAYSGAVLWNSLPSAARQATSLTNFRRFLINSDTAFM